MDTGVVMLQVVVALGAIAAIVKTRSDRRSRYIVACAATALALQMLWLLLEALGSSVALIARLSIPFAIALPLLLVLGKLSENRSGDWLNRASQLEPVPVSRPAAEALRDEREARSDEIAHRAQRPHEPDR